MAPKQQERESTEKQEIEGAKWWFQLTRTQKHPKSNLLNSNDRTGLLNLKAETSWVDPVGKVGDSQAADTVRKATQGESKTTYSVSFAAARRGGRIINTIPTEIKRERETESKRARERKRVFTVERKRA